MYQLRRKADVANWADLDAFSIEIAENPPVKKFDSGTRSYRRDL